VDAIPQAVDKTLSKEARTAWWNDHPVDTISGLLSLPIGAHESSASRGRAGSTVDVEANSSSELEVNQDERGRSSTEQMADMPGELDPGPKRTIVDRFSALHRPEGGPFPSFSAQNTYESGPSQIVASQQYLTSRSEDDEDQDHQHDMDMDDQGHQHDPANQQEAYGGYLPRPSDIINNKNTEETFPNPLAVGVMPAQTEPTTFHQQINGSRLDELAVYADQSLPLLVTAPDRQDRFEHLGQVGIPSLIRETTSNDLHVMARTVPAVRATRDLFW
jgi:hypothetical protein